MARMLASLMGMGAVLAGCTDRRAMTAAAEAQQQGPTTPEVPFDHELVPKLRPCNAEAAIAAMASPEPPKRAAGALCAAQSACDHLEVNAGAEPPHRATPPRRPSTSTVVRCSARVTNTCACR